MRQVESLFQRQPPYTLVTYAHSDRKREHPRTLHVSSQELIGGHGFGQVYKIQSNFPAHNQEETHTAVWALKVYYGKPDAPKAQAKYALVRAAKIPTWNTCRITADNQQLLLTLNFTNNCYVVAARAEEARHTRNLALDFSLDTVAQICREIGGIARQATQAGLGFSFDVYFFVISQDQKFVQVIAGDFDAVHEEENSSVLLQRNLGNAVAAMTTFITSYCPHLDLMDPKLQSIIRDIHSGTLPQGST